MQNMNDERKRVGCNKSMVYNAVNYGKIHLRNHKFFELVNISLFLTRTKELSLASLCGGVDHTPFAFARATFSWLLLLICINRASLKIYFSFEDWSARER